MSISRYNKPIDYKLQANQILPRTEILIRGMMARQQKYDTQAAKLQEAQGTISGYKVVGDAAQKDLKVVEDSLIEASGSLIKRDLSDPSVQGEVNSLINDIAGNPKIKMHLAAAEQYKKFSDQYEDLSKRGKVAEGNVYFQKQAWDRYKTTGVFEETAAMPIEEAVDIETENKRYFDMIKASGGDAIAYLTDGTAFKNSSKGVGRQEIISAVEGALLKYSNSQAGRQLSREYSMLVDKGVINPSKTSLEGYLRNSLLTTGQKYMYNDSSTNMDVALRAKQGRDLRKAEETATEMGYTPAFASPNAKVELDEKGNVKGKDVGIFDLMNTFGVTQGAAMWFNGSFDASDEATKEQTKVLKENAKNSGLTTEQYVEALNSDPNIAVKYYVNSKMRDNESARFFNPKTGGGEFYTRKIYTPEYPTGISAQEYMSEEGISEQELKSGFTMVGEVLPDNPYTPLGKTALINGKQVIIDDSPNASGEEVGVWKASQAKYNGKGSVEFEHNGTTYKYRWDPKTDEVVRVK